MKSFQRHRATLTWYLLHLLTSIERLYSEDENQSYKKYGSTYESKRDGFLKPTLETAVEWAEARISSLEHRGYSGERKLSSAGGRFQEHPT